MSPREGLRDTCWQIGKGGESWMKRREDHGQFRASLGAASGVAYLCASGALFNGRSQSCYSLAVLLTPAFPPPDCRIIFTLGMSRASRWGPTAIVRARHWMHCALKRDHSQDAREMIGRGDGIPDSDGPSTVSYRGPNRWRSRQEFPRV